MAWLIFIMVWRMLSCLPAQDPIWLWMRAMAWLRQTGEKEIPCPVIAPSRSVQLLTDSVTIKNVADWSAEKHGPSLGSLATLPAGGGVTAVRLPLVKWYRR